MNSIEEIKTKIESEEFKEYCNNNIIPKAKKLNLIRLKSGLILFLCAALYCVLFYKYYSVTQGDNRLFFLCTAAVILIVLLQFAVITVKNYKTNVKDLVFSELLSYIGNFENESSPNFADLISTKMFKSSNRICCDDAIKGEYKSQKIQIFEITVDKAPIYFENIATQNMFTGILVKFRYKTVNDTPFYVFPAAKNVEDEAYKPVKVENAEFNSYYSIFSPDPDNAIQNINEELLNKFIALAKIGHDKDTSVSSENGEMNIAILSNKDNFEVSFLKSPENTDNYKAVIKDIADILFVADIFI